MKRQVLECFDKRTLVELSKAVGFAGSQVLRKDEIVDNLVRKRSVGLEDLLAKLDMNICANLGGVSKQEQIDKILGKGNRMEKKPTYEELEQKVKKLEKIESELRESKIRYQTLFDKTPAGLAVTTSDGRALAVNSATLHMMGYKAIEFSQINMLECYQNPKDREAILKRLTTEGFVRDFETQLRRKDGSTFHGSMTVTPFPMNGENAYLTVVMDINKSKQAEKQLQQAHEKLERMVEIRTSELAAKNRQLEKEIRARKRSEKSLRESEQKYRALVDNIGMGVMLLSPNMEILTLNNKMKEWFPDIDNSKKPICYKVLNDYPLQTVCPDCPTHKTLQDGQVHEAVIELTAGIKYRMVSSAVRDAEGKISAAIEVFEDITEREKMQERLQASESKYRTIFETTTVANMIVEQDTTISMVNKEFEKLSGCSKEQIEGKKSFPEFVAKEELERVLDYHRKRRIDPKAVPTRYECRVHDRKGNIRDAFLNVAVLPGTTSSVVSLLDITKLKQTERKLRESEQRLHHLSSQLLAAQENERKRISMEIHDELGPNLAVLKIQLKGIANRLRKDQSEIKAAINNSMEFIDRNIEGMRQLSRDLSPTIIQEMKLCGALKWMLNEFKNNTNIDVSMDMVDIDDQFGHDDQILLYRIFQEALNNIRKHAQARHVSLVIKKEDDHVIFQIEDDGKGFDYTEALNRHVTERGMGLSALDERARMIGGVLDLFTQKGKGTRITLVISPKLPRMMGR